MNTTSDQQVRKGRKFSQVLEGARKVFLRDGFDGASVDDIAREAGVSKATLYSYVPDKRLLFLEVAKAELTRQADEAEALIDASAAVGDMLRLAALRIIDFQLSDFGQRIYRIFVSESDRFPGLGQEFYQSGPLLIRARLVGFFACAVEDGQLAIEDLELATEQFMQLCKADLQDQQIFGLAKVFSDEDRARIAEGAVSMFMARYGAKTGV